MKIYIQHEGKTYGPLDVAEAKDYLEHGAFFEHDIAFTENDSEGKPLRAFLDETIAAPPDEVELPANEDGQTGDLIYVEQGGQTYGPFSADQASAYLEDGTFEENANAWTPGDAQCRPLRSLVDNGALSSSGGEEYLAEGQEAQSDYGPVDKKRQPIVLASILTGSILVVALVCAALVKKHDSQTKAPAINLSQAGNFPTAVPNVSTPVAAPAETKAPNLASEPKAEASPSAGIAAKDTHLMKGNQDAVASSNADNTRPPVASTGSDESIQDTSGEENKAEVNQMPQTAEASMGQSSEQSSNAQTASTPSTAEAASATKNSIAQGAKDSGPLIQNTNVASTPSASAAGMSNIDSGPTLHPFDTPKLAEKDLLGILSDRFASPPVNTVAVQQKGDPSLGVYEGSFTLKTNLKWNPEVQIIYSIPLRFGRNPGPYASNVLMVGYFPKAALPPPFVSNAYFVASDFTQIPSLEQKLGDPKNKIGRYFLQKIYRPDRKVLFDPKATVQQKQDLLVANLNAVLSGDPIYDPDLFPIETLSPATQNLITQKVQKERLLWLNRMILEDCFPAEIKKKPMDTLIKDIRQRNPIVYRDLDNFAAEQGFTAFTMQIVTKPEMERDPAECYYLGGPQWVDLVFRAQEELIRRYNLKSRGLLVTGMSLGGAFAERIAAARPDRVAAVAIHSAPEIGLPDHHTSTAWFLGITRGDSMYSQYDELYNRLLKLKDPVALQVFPPNYGMVGRYHTETDVAHAAGNAFLRGAVDSYDSAGKIDTTQWPYLRDRTKPLRIIRNGSLDVSLIPEANREYLPSRAVVESIQSVSARIQTMDLTSVSGVHSLCMVGLPPLGKPKGVIVYSSAIDYSNIQPVIDEINFLSDKGYLVLAPRLGHNDASQLKNALDFVQRTPLLNQFPLLCLGNGDKGSTLWNAVATNQNLSPKVVAFLDFDGEEAFGETNLPVGSRISCPILFVYSEMKILNATNSEDNLIALEKLHRIDGFLAKCKERHQPVKVMFVPEEAKTKLASEDQIVAQASVNFVDDIFDKLLTGHGSVMNAR